MQISIQMDLDDWREAQARGELWMFVDDHWAAYAPSELTLQEWGEHINARFTARAGIPPVAWRAIS